MLRRRVLCFIAMIVGLVLVFTGIAKIWQPIYLSRTLHLKNTSKQKQLLYELESLTIATTLRSFATTHGWGKNNTVPEHYQKSDAEVPIMLRGLGFSLINVYDERVDIDFGGPFLSFGLSVFPDGVEGEGTKKLGPGIWFYSEDGYYPGPDGEKRAGPPSK